MTVGISLLLLFQRHSAEAPNELSTYLVTMKRCLYSRDQCCRPCYIVGGCQGGDDGLCGTCRSTYHIVRIITYLAAKTAHEAWSVQYKEEFVFPLQAFSSERPPSKQIITTLVHQKKSEEITPGSTRLRIIRNSMKLLDAKTWGNCRPSLGYATYIPNHHSKVWLQYFCQLPLSEAGARCTRPRCAAVLDMYGDNLLYCERGSHRIRRHDAQVRLLAGDLAKAARHTIVEETPPGGHRKRPDIRALGRTRGTDLFDVTIYHPLSQARIRDAVQNPLNILKAAWAGKVSRYAGTVQETGRSV